MERHSRRSMLGAGLAGMAGAAVHTLSGGALASKPAIDPVESGGVNDLEALIRRVQRPLPSPNTNQLKLLAEENRKNELDELVKFWNLVIEIQVERRLYDTLDRIGHRGTTLPSSTLPQCLLVRLTAQQSDLPEPQIHTIHEIMLGGTNLSEHYLAEVCMQLAERLGVIHKKIDVVWDLDLLTPDGHPVPVDRVSSKIYVVDVDKDDMRTTALVLLDSVVSVWNEWRSKLRGSAEAATYAASVVGSARPVRTECQVRPVSVGLTRKNFFLEVCAWNTGGGYSFWPSTKMCDKLERVEMCDVRSG
jgi:hypothetical protein